MRCSQMRLVSWRHLGSWVWAWSSQRDSGSQLELGERGFYTSRSANRLHQIPYLSSTPPCTNQSKGRQSLEHKHENQSKRPRHTVATHNLHKHTCRAENHETELGGERLVVRSWRKRNKECALICSHTKAILGARACRHKQGGSSTLVGLEPDLHILKGPVGWKPARTQWTFHNTVGN